MEDDDDLLGDELEKISDQDIEEEEQPLEPAPVAAEPASQLASQEPADPAADRLSSQIEPISSPDSLREEVEGRLLVFPQVVTPVF